MAAERAQTVVVDGHSIKLTNLGKVLYPVTGTTKADVISYYASVAEVMLPHLRQRPATRKGTPDWVERYVIEHRDHDNYYPVVNQLATLTWLGQLAALELHVPQWRFSEPTRTGGGGEPQNPDRLVLD